VDGPAPLLPPVQQGGGTRRTQIRPPGQLAVWLVVTAEDPSWGIARAASGPTGPIAVHVLFFLHIGVYVSKSMRARRGPTEFQLPKICHHGCRAF